MDDPLWDIPMKTFQKKSNPKELLADSSFRGHNNKYVDSSVYQEIHKFSLEVVSDDEEVHQDAQLMTQE